MSQLLLKLLVAVDSEMFPNVTAITFVYLIYVARENQTDHVSSQNPRLLVSSYHDMCTFQIQSWNKLV